MIQDQESQEWIYEYIAKLQGFFGLTEWEISYRLREELIYEGIDCKGLTSVPFRHYEAHIQLDADIQPDIDGYRTLTHEILHIVFARLENATARITELINRKNLRNHAEALWLDAEELTIERLALSITNLLAPAELFGEDVDSSVDAADVDKLVQTVIEHAPPTTKPQKNSKSARYWYYEDGSYFRKVRISK